MRPVRPSRSAAAWTALIASALFCGAFATAPALAGDRFGVNAQVLFWSEPQSSWARNAQEMSKDGIQIVRTDAFWSNAEPHAPIGGVHTYYWNKLDAIELTLAANGIRWQPIVDYSTAWSASARTSSGAPNLKSPPANNADYAAYAAALVQRYGPGGSFWTLHPELTPIPVTAVELWNEANNSADWQPKPSPAAYAALYEAARSAIDTVDPGVAAIAAPSSNPTAPFLQSMYSALGGASGMIDAIAMHPYADRPHDMYYDIADTRMVLEQHGDQSVPIDVTEFGWPTQGFGANYTVVSDATRANYFTQVTQTLTQSSCGIDRIEPHTWVTPERNVLSPEDWFGVVHPNGVRTATENQYSATIKSLEAGAASGGTPSASACAQQLDVPLGSTMQQPKPAASPLGLFGLRLG